MVEAAKLDEYGVCNFIVKNCEGHLVRVGIGGRSVRVNNLSAPENPRRYVRMCMYELTCVMQLCLQFCCFICTKDPISSDDRGKLQQQQVEDKIQGSHPRP